MSKKSKEFLDAHGHPGRHSNKTDVPALADSPVKTPVKASGASSSLPPFKTQFNKHLFPTDHEVITLPSMAVPDQSMTVRQLIDRHTRGIPFPVGKVPLYENEDSIIPTDWATWDLSEKEQFKQDLADKVIATRKAWEKEQEEKKEKDRRESYRKEFEAEQAQKKMEQEAIERFESKKPA